MEKVNDIYENILRWREEHIPEKHFVLLLSFFVGVFTACSAYVLKLLIHTIQTLLFSIPFLESYPYLYLLFPALGIALSAIFVTYIVREDISHGITKILFAFSQRKSIIKPHNMWSSVVGSAITIGFGGSVGAEAPIVLTGAAIGSNMAKFFHLPQRTMMLMIGCGAAGAIGGIFKAPIAGLVFTLEVLLLDMTMASLSPLLISSITATALAYIFSGTEPMFQLSGVSYFAVSRIPYYLLLGLACGLVSLYFTKGMDFLESQFKRVKSMWTKMAIGGITLAVLIWLFPPLYGEGYDMINTLMNADAYTTLSRSPLSHFNHSTALLIAYLMLIIFFKIFASVATNGGGGVGGIFAPSLFVGAIAGFVVGLGLNIIGINVSLQNFTLVGMAGLMSGVMHAPLTGIFLIAELTGGYHLFMPLMIVSVVSYLFIMLFEPHSLYSKRLAKKGELLTHNKDRSVLTLLKIDSIIETDLTTLHPDMSLGQLVRLISVSHRNLFPVVDDDGQLLGVLSLDEVRNIMFQPRLYHRFTVRQLMTSPPALLTHDMSMERVMEIFEDTGAWNLPVVDEQKKYLGFISKSKIFNSYRHVLVHFSEE